MADASGSTPATVQTGEKCGDFYDTGPYAPVAAWNPLGGATSFDEADSYERAEDATEAVNELTMAFGMIVSNILGSDDLTLTQKADLTIKAAADLKKRLASSPEVLGLPDNDDGVGFAEAGFLKKLGIGKKKPKAGDPKAKTGPMAAKKDDEHARPRPRLHAPAAQTPGFRMFKDLKGETRWIAVHSNHFEDKERETFPASAHKAFEQLVDETGQYPELRFWHVPGSRLGVADWISFDDSGFMVSSGTIDPGMKEAAERLPLLGPLGVSHGYWYDRKESDGSIPAYRDFEISVLPLDRAANELTAFAFEEVPAMLPAAKKEALSTVLGVDLANELERTLSTAGQKARAAGIAFKDAGPIATTLGEAFASGFKDEEPSAPASSPAATPPAGSTSAGASGLTAEQLTAAIAQAVAPVMARVEQLAGGLNEAQEAVKALAEGEDTRLASMFRPRLGVVPSSGMLPGSKEAEATAEALKAEADKAMGKDAAGAPEHIAYALEMMGALPGKASA